jgi:hypothetical protein
MKRGTIEKYLNGHAESEAQHFPDNFGRWAHVVCIPACAESGSLIETLQEMATVRHADTALVIVVVNGRQSASSVVHQSNADSWDELVHAAALQGDQLAQGTINGMGVLALDRWSDGRCLPEKQGVGLARKIGGDIALALIHRGHVEQDWIRCTDADVRVPQDFFEQLADVSSDVSAVIAPFVLVPEGDAAQRKAMAIYDEYLQSYVDGLRGAGSPYAFHTIGSLISIRAQSYAAVRGIPRREAGEDFYLLNKLAKVGRVVSLEGSPIQIRGRLSDRVPFGTGAALHEICDALERNESYRSYDPRVFEGLAHWLRALEEFVIHSDVATLQGAIEDLEGPLGSALFQTLESMGAFTAAEQASRQVSGVQLRRRLMEWNDAFRTLKLIHGLRDEGIEQSPK